MAFGTSHPPSYARSKLLLRWYEFLLNATSSICDRPEKQLEMIGVIWAFTLGSVTYELGEMENNRRHGLTEAKKRKIAEPYIKSVLATGRYPQLAKVIASRTAKYHR